MPIEIKAYWNKKSTRLIELFIDRDRQMIVDITLTLGSTVIKMIKTTDGDRRTFSVPSHIKKSTALEDVLFSLGERLASQYSCHLAQFETRFDERCVTIPEKIVWHDAKWYEKADLLGDD